MNRNDAHAITVTAETRIPNHVAASMSELELEMARHVPPGGNWRDIPDRVPSRRLEQIRRSSAEGKGSRSTYYGRLLPDEPSFTINTYFTRVGNGCHLHYDTTQNRTLTLREAARLQSFPDRFVFQGTQGAIQKQIGNAVPPLLAYAVGHAFESRFAFVDLFSGAGGLSLGLEWAGWESVIAVDSFADACATYNANLGVHCIRDDLRDPDVKARILDVTERRRKTDGSLPLAVVGGPPCQGFSTAGNRRSLTDPRNWLFRDMLDVVDMVRPELVVMENVTGITNMEGGAVFQMIQEEFAARFDLVTVWRLNAAEFGVPQRRKRVLIVAVVDAFLPLVAPHPVCEYGGPPSLFGRSGPVTVRDAISDLPRCEPKEDASRERYRNDPDNAYQMLMRGVVDPATFIGEYFGNGR